MRIAIKGHPTRRKEVIQTLENLGGRNTKNWKGDGDILDGFFINNDGIIVFDNLPEEYKLYTLEEFEQEFPFKIGDKVIYSYAPVIGTVVDIKFDDHIPYRVDIMGKIYTCETAALKLYKEMKEERNITLTLDKAKEWYKKGGELKEIALQAFNEKELNPLPRSWEEFCETFPIDQGEAYISSFSRVIEYGHSENRNLRGSENMCPSRKSAEAHLAMIQLEQLRDCWRQGWKPTKHDTGYCITHYSEEYSIMSFYFISFLSFPTEEMAEEFLKCFRDLIEKAGDLI